jgi:hypothetical protein
MKVDFIGCLKTGFVWFLQRHSPELAQRAEDSDFRDDERDRSAREYEFDYWAVRGPWY